MFTLAWAGIPARVGALCSQKPETDAEFFLIS